MEWLIILGIIGTVAIFIYRAGSDARADKIATDAKIEERAIRRASAATHDEMASASDSTVRDWLK